MGCDSKCRFNTNICEGTQGRICPDKNLNPGEECDTTLPTNLNCRTINSQWIGSVSCTSLCFLDVSECTGFCGNSIREDSNPGGRELCDNTDISVTCQDFGFSGGSMGCTKTSCTFNTDKCTCDPGTTTCIPEGSCGDGIINPGEQCDDTIPSNLDCKSISTSWDGELTCGTDTFACDLNINDCIPTCLNGRLDDNEICDPTARGTPSNPNPRINECSELGFERGDITCTQECKLNTNQCKCADNDSNCINSLPICDGNALNPGEECDGNTFDNINSCSDIISSWEGDLDCNPDTCRIDFNDCKAIDTRECVSCEDCNRFFGSCGANQCVNFCGLDRGNCFYDENLLLPDRCISCDEIKTCEHYTRQEDCEAHKEEGLPGGRCIGYALNSNNQVADCRWDGNNCVENIECEWNCPDLEVVYGECQSDDFRYPTSVSAAKCTELNNNVNCGINGELKLPDKIKCGVYSEEKVFPVFDGLNILISVLLLISYYIVRRKFNPKI